MNEVRKLCTIPDEEHLRDHPKILLERFMNTPGTSPIVQRFVGPTGRIFLKVYNYTSGSPGRLCFGS